MLYDFYGNLLNESQQRVVELCVNEDLSLSEAADILKISRQGVRDSLKRATDKLNVYEEKLGLCSRFKSDLTIFHEALETCDKIKEISSDDTVNMYIDSIKNKLNSLYTLGENNGF